MPLEGTCAEHAPGKLGHAYAGEGPGDVCLQVESLVCWSQDCVDPDWHAFCNLVLCRRVTDEALLQLPKFPVLASLILRGTPASNAGLQPLGSMACLQQLDLGSKWELNDAGAPGAAGQRF